MSITKTPQSKLTSSKLQTKPPRAVSARRPSTSTTPAPPAVPAARSPRSTSGTTAAATTPAEDPSTAAPVAVGVDISKAYLDVDAPGAHWRVPNTPAGVQELLAQLPPGARLFVEAGSYGRCLREAAFAASVPIALLNPLRVRFFAKSRGLLAKTDRLDARALRLYGESTPCRFAQPLGPELEQLAVLVSLRDQLVKTLTQLSNCGEHVPAAVRAGQQALAVLQKQLRQQIAKLEAAARQLIAAQPALAERAKALVAEYGIADVISFTLLAGLPELGTVNRGEIAALVGLAPHAHDSGTSSGRRRISGGRANVRRALYLATVTAIRAKDSVLRRSYLHLRHSGKPSKVALLACARKFLLFLNSKIQKLASLKLSPKTIPPSEK